MSKLTTLSVCQTTREAYRKNLISQTIEENLPADKGKKIVVEFIPWFPQQYDMVLVVNLEGVKQNMLAVPIKTECLVPKVKITPSDYLDFKDVFLAHPKTAEIELK